MKDHHQAPKNSWHVSESYAKKAPNGLIGFFQDGFQVVFLTEQRKKVDDFMIRI